MKSIFHILPIALSMGTLPLAAETIEIHPDLALAASKVDAGAPFFEISLVDGHIEKLLPYADLISGLIGGDEDFPGTDVRSLLESSGYLDLKAIAKSGLQQGDSWLNKTYYLNGGAQGIMGGVGKKFDILSSCLKGTDIAFEVHLNGSEVSELLKALNDFSEIQAGASSEAGKEAPPLGAAAKQGNKQGDVSILLGVRFDLAEQQDEGAIPGLKDYVLRVDGLAKLWEKLGNDFIKENFLGVEVEVKVDESNGIVTYLIGSEGGVDGADWPMIVVDAAADRIWFSNSKELITESGKAGEQLVDDTDFLNTWTGMPELGNMMLYVSPDFVGTGADFIAGVVGDWSESQSGLGKHAVDAGLLIEKLAKDLAGTKSGLGYSVSKDGDGYLTASKLPIPQKYIDSALSSYGVLATLLSIVEHVGSVEQDVDLESVQGTGDELADLRESMRIAREAGVDGEDLKEMEAIYEDLEEQFAEIEDPNIDLGSDEYLEKALREPLEKAFRESLENMEELKELGADADTLKQVEDMHKEIEKSLNELNGGTSLHGKDR